MAEEKIDKKKTAKAYQTTNENAEKVTEEMISEENEKEIQSIEEEKQKKIKELEEQDKKELKQTKPHLQKTDGEIFESWEPKTNLGRKVKEGAIKDIDEILNQGKKILEEQIVDLLLDLKSDLIVIGQSKGKFGGGKRRAWRQTQRKTKEGNVPVFSAMAVVGNENGYVGVGTGKAKETLPSRDKALRKAKLNIFKVGRACASFDCECSEKHTVPFEVWGKSGSVRVKLMPAPQGAGLVVGDNLKPILKLAGIKDVYSKTFGQKKTTFNLVKACIDALKKTNVKEDKK